MQIACSSNATLRVTAPQMRRSESSVAVPARMPAAKASMKAHIASQKHAFRGLEIASAKQQRPTVACRATRLVVDASKNVSDQTGGP